ncbi:histidine--tRNA ligase [Candidatus Acetothermia bacterium]|nr:histidine--tRNA ligase [Candidatus Acetothermia bacterium]
MELQLPRGMSDTPPEEKILRDELIGLIRKTFEAYGFNPLETPIVERWEILAAKYAGGSELLKETFKLTDQGQRDLGLRYDLTVPLARYIGMNPTIKRPFKRYQIGTVYRDGPVKLGRTREFYQCDADTVGVRSMLADAECLNIAADVFSKLGFDYELQVNNRKILNDLLAKVGLTGDAAFEALISLDKLDKLGQDGVRKELMEKKIASEAIDQALELIQVGGNSEERMKAIAMRIPESEGLRELRELYAYVDAPERVIFTPRMVRGQAYYTGTIFESYVRDSKINSAFGSGGRWDNMIGTFLGSKEQYPAVGFSFGLEPILQELKMRRAESAEGLPKCVTQVYVIPFKAIVKEGRQIAQQLRRAGINTDMDLAGKGISDNLKYANAYSIPYVLIVGPDELVQSKVKLRDMRSGQEEMLSVEDVIVRLRTLPS